MKLSEPVEQVLSKYPSWRNAVEQALLQPPLALNHSSVAVEVFNSSGLLCGTILGQAYQLEKLSKEPSEFTAWFLDGQLAVFYVGSEVVVNRLSLMSVAAATVVEG